MRQMLGRTVLVIGGTGGIGRATATGLVTMVAHIAITGRAAARVPGGMLLARAIPAAPTHGEPSPTFPPLQRRGRPAEERAHRLLAIRQQRRNRRSARTSAGRRRDVRQGQLGVEHHLPWQGA